MQTFESIMFLAFMINSASMNIIYIVYYRRAYTKTNISMENPMPTRYLLFAAKGQRWLRYLAVPDQGIQNVTKG